MHTHQSQTWTATVTLLLIDCCCVWNAIIVNVNVPLRPDHTVTYYRSALCHAVVVCHLPIKTHTSTVSLRASCYHLHPSHIQFGLAIHVFIAFKNNFSCRISSNSAQVYTFVKSPRNKNAYLKHCRVRHRPNTSTLRTMLSIVISTYLVCILTVSNT